jgi:uncharacterized protein
MPGLIGNTAVLRGLRPADFTDDRFGLPTVSDILRELEKPGRDPRPAFTTATFAEGVETLQDLAPGMVLEGVVTNVAAFGAFVDVGVHQDGLVHVSAMSRDFVSDPRQVAKPGDVVRVRVLSVDIPRKRIGLSLRLDDEPASQGGQSGQGDHGGQGGQAGQGSRRPGRDQSRGDQPGRDRPRRPQPGRDRGQGGRDRGQPGRESGQGGRDRRDQPAAGGAMADALRRAGLAGGAAADPKDRRPR